jgi:hypothetical protein
MRVVDVRSPIVLKIRVGEEDERYRDFATVAASIHNEP